MFFAGFALIIGVWFVGSMVRAKDFKTFKFAEMIGALFMLFMATFAVGILINPMGAGAWAFSLFGFVIVGFTLSLFAAAWFKDKKHDVVSGRRMGDTTAVASETAYMKVFVGLTVVTMLCALVTRLIG